MVICIMYHGGLLWHHKTMQARAERLGSRVGRQAAVWFAEDRRLSPWILGKLGAVHGFLSGTLGAEKYVGIMCVTLEGEALRALCRMSR